MWWNWTMGPRWNFVLDVRPTTGHRFVMDALPGLVHSGSDFAMNDAGIVLTETTISGFRGFDPSGVPEFVRMREAIQRADSVDAVVARFREGNNGGYANAWLIGDVGTKEIARLELGLKHTPLARTKSGLFYGANFPENPDLIRDEVPGGYDPNPETNGCARRRLRWSRVLTDDQGRIDLARAQGYLADTVDAVTGEDQANEGTLCGRGPGGGAVNAKAADAASIRSMTFLGRMNAPDGRTIRFGRTLPPHPWTRL
jgi:hypothetical protein